jgi:hypothetical protein
LQRDSRRLRTFVVSAKERATGISERPDGVGCVRTR